MKEQFSRNGRNSSRIAPSLVIGPNYRGKSLKTVDYLHKSKFVKFVIRNCKKVRKKSPCTWIL